MLTLKGKEKDSEIFAFTNYSSALGWPFKSIFLPATQSSHDKVARENRSPHGLHPSWKVRL